MKKFPTPIRSTIIAIFLFFIMGCSISPASAWIVYHEADRLWRMRPDGSDIKQVTSSGWHGEYSPDNSKIVYSEFYDTGIWLADADGANPVRLTSFGSGPTWSPDGDRLAFHVGGQAGASRSIWIMNADGSDAHQVSTVPGSFPDWSPLGDKILFHGEVNSGIWLISPDGSSEMQLYRDGAYPAWSVDGEKISYVNLYDWCIWVMDEDGTGQRKLTDHGGLHPAWSDDGLQIVYETTEGIWIINSDGTGDHRINKEGKNPDWSN